MLPITSSTRERAQTLLEYKKRSNTNPKKSNFAPPDNGSSGKISGSNLNSSDYNRDAQPKTQSDESIDILED